MAKSVKHTKVKSEKSSLLERLDYLKSTLKQNWNGEDDLPIEEYSYLNCKAAIACMPECALSQWDLFPDPNGTLLLSAKNGIIAAISIGNFDFSFAALDANGKELLGKETFSTDAFQRAAQQIHRHVGLKWE